MLSTAILIMGSGTSCHAKEVSPVLRSLLRLPSPVVPCNSRISGKPGAGAWVPGTGGRPRVSQAARKSCARRFPRRDLECLLFGLGMNAVLPVGPHRDGLLPQSRAFRPIIGQFSCETPSAPRGARRPRRACRSRAPDSGLRRKYAQSPLQSSAQTNRIGKAQRDLLDHHRIHIEPDAVVKPDLHVRIAQSISSPGGPVSVAGRRRDRNWPTRDMMLV